MKSHEDLDVWKRGVDFAVSIYELTNEFPDNEKFGLISQMRRAAVSISSNIAEGAARSSQREFYQFLSIALGSASELDTQLIISNRLDFAPHSVLNNLRNELKRISRMLIGLRKAVDV